MSIFSPSLRAILLRSARSAVLRGTLPATRLYLQAVEAADGQQLELDVLRALAAQADARIPLGGQYIPLCGARTLAGALVPMVGPAPTNINLLDADYSRTRGVKGNKTDKRIEANVADSAYSQNSVHLAIDVTEVSTLTNDQRIIMGTTAATATLTLFALASQFNLIARNRTSGSTAIVSAGESTASLKMTNRTSVGTLVVRSGATENSYAQTSITPSGLSIGILAESGTNVRGYNGRVRCASNGPGLTDTAAYRAQHLSFIDALSAALAVYYPDVYTHEVFTP